jgi:hypothetical protein
VNDETSSLGTARRVVRRLARSFIARAISTGSMLLAITPDGA